MPYEIDFIGVNEETKDADAICMRWISDDSKYIIGVFDGGFKSHGERTVELLKQHYFDNDEEMLIDFVVCSHADADHASGLTEVLENFEVKALYMNRPWLYIDYFEDKITDGRINLEKKLKKVYPYIAKLEEIAIDKKIPIYEIFQGDQIEEKIQVLSPEKQFYLDLIVEDSRTPLEESVLEKFMSTVYEKTIEKISESWDVELLKSSVVTTPINETSTVILGDMDEEKFLLVGDAGLRAISIANEYAASIGINLSEEVQIYQIAHHGGRHNVSTELLNAIIGEKVEEGTTINKKAYVMAGKNTDHPKKMVTNAYIRRGVKVYPAKGTTINHHRGDMPDREGWSSVKPELFSEEVESWD